MIKLSKEPEPTILSANKESWTTQVLDHIAAGTKIPKTLENKYNTKEVKGALRVECKSKCMEPNYNINANANNFHHEFFINANYRY